MPATERATPLRLGLAPATAALLAGLAGCGSDAGNDGGAGTAAEPVAGQALPDGLGADAPIGTIGTAGTTEPASPSSPPAPSPEPSTGTPTDPIDVADPDPALEPDPVVATEVRCAAFDEAARALVLGLVNAARAEARRCGTDDYPAAPALVWDDRLGSAATGHSADMATHDFFSHTGSDGGSVADRVSAEGFPWSAVGENIAAGQATAADAMAGWLESPGHCRNVMNARYASLGMACSADAGTSWGTYWTQVFARSR